MPLITDKRKAARIAAFFIVVAAAILLLVGVRSIIGPFVFGAVLAYLINPWIEKQNALGVPLLVSTIVIYLYIFLALYLLVFMTLPLIGEQLDNLFLYLADMLDGISTWGDSFFASLGNNSVAGSLQNILQDTSNGMRERLLGSGAQMVDTVMSLPKILLYLLLSPILSYYLLRDKKQMIASLVNLISPKNQGEFLRVCSEINKLIREFVSGYLLISLIVAVISTVIYALLGLDYPLVLGILMGIGDLIPYIGPFIGAIPALLIAISMNQTIFILTLVAILIIQQLEGNVITPRIIDQRIGLNPVLTIFAVMAGGLLFGISGAIFAMPLTAVLILLGEYLFAQVFRNNDLINHG